MLVPGSQVDGTKVHYEVQRMRSMAAYEQRWDLTPRATLVGRLWGRVMSMVGRVARRPAVGMPSRDARADVRIGEAT